MRNLVIWLCEMLGQAVGTVVCILAIGAIRSEPDFAGNRGLHELVTFADVKLYLFAVAFTLIAFAFTGYLLTTWAAAWLLESKNRLLYPSLSAGLYLIHSELFFRLAGQPLSDRHNDPIQIAGAFVTFGITWYGISWRTCDRLKGKNQRSNAGLDNHR